MASKRARRALDGWVVIDKPSGMTSSQVVGQVRRQLNAQKAGHGGTLDPDATGLLPIALGEATKLIPYLDEAPKRYEFAALWGAETDTDDAAGEVIAQAEQRPSEAEIEAVLPQFRGDIMQVPPKVSAVKVNGRRAYDMARAGEAMELEARPLHVARLDLISHDDEMTHFAFECSKGGYVRAIARDIGRALGSLGHVHHLRRTDCLGFSIDDAIGLDAISDDAIWPLLDTPLLPHLALEQAQVVPLFHGHDVEITGAQCALDAPQLAVYDGIAVAMIGSAPGKFRVLRGLRTERLQEFMENENLGGDR